MLTLTDYVGVLTFAALLYLNSLRGDFVYDDSRAIVENVDLRPETRWAAILNHDFWGTPINSSNSHGSYRPLVVATFRLNYWLQGTQPFSFHLVNLLIHLLVVALYGRLLEVVLGMRRSATLVALVLFATHPVHVESVASIVARADLMAAAAFILALLSYHEFIKLGLALHLVRCLLAAAAALLSKEYAITCLPACAALHVLLEAARLPASSRGQLRTAIREIVSKDRVRQGLCHLVVGFGAMVALRFWVMGGQRPTFAKADNPAAAHESVITRTATFLYLPAFNFALLVCPRWLSFDWSMEAIPLVESIDDRRNLASMAFYGSLVFLMVLLTKFYREGPRRGGEDQSIELARNCKRKYIPAEMVATSQLSIPNEIHENDNQIDYNHYLPPLNYNLLDDNNNLNLDENNNAGDLNANINDHNQPMSNAYSASKRHPQLIYTEVKSVAKSAKEQKKPRRKRWKLRSSLEPGLSDQDRLMVALLLMVVPFLPATNLFFHIGFVVAERILYLPSTGYCLLVAIGFEVLCRRLQTVRAVLYLPLGIVIVAFATRTIVRTFDWLDEESLYRSAIDINPPKALGNLANVLSGQGRRVEAELAYRAALTHRPNMADVHYNLGLLLQEEARPLEAIESYRRAISYRPRLAVAYLNLGIVLVKLGRLDEAKLVYQKCAQLDGHGTKNIRLHETTKVSALYNLGRIFADQGDYHRAIEHYLEAVRRAPRHYRAQSLYNMLGDAYSRLNRTREAEIWFQRSLKEAKGGHVPTFLSYGHMLAKANRTREAERFFRKAVRLAPNDTGVHQHYGQFLSNRGEFILALEHYRRALDLSSAISTSNTARFDIVLNLANTLRELKMNIEAEVYYEQAVALDPSNVLGHSNLGAIYHLNGKFEQAERTYHRALTLRPDDSITLTNLSKLRQAMTSRKT